MLITAKIAFIFTSITAVQIYDFHIFTTVYSPLHGFIWNQHSDQLPVGLLAQLVEHCTGIAEVMGSNPVQAWIFFRPSFHYYLSSVHYCEDRFHIHVFNRSSNIWLPYIHNRSIKSSWLTWNVCDYSEVWSVINCTAALSRRDEKVSGTDLPKYNVLIISAHLHVAHVVVNK